MPFIPSFSFDSLLARAHPSTATNASSPGNARSSPQPSFATPGSNSSPRLVGSAIARGQSSSAEFREGAVLLRASSSDASAVQLASSRSTSRSHSSGSAAAASRNNGADQQNTTAGSTHSSHSGGADREADRSLSQSADIPLLSGQEEETASPGRRFMNIHRRARRERARSEIVYSFRDNTDGRTPDVGSDLDDYGIPLFTNDGAGPLPSHAADGTTTGASLRRAQYATSGFIDRVESEQPAREAGGRVSLDVRTSGRSLAEALRRASDSVVQSSGTSSGRRSERAVAAGSSMPPTVTPRTDITILVASPPVQLTTSHDALRRLAQNTIPSALQPQDLSRSAPTSAAASPHWGTATPSASRVPVAREAAADIHVSTTSTGWRRAHAAYSEGDDAPGPTLPKCNGSSPLTNWQLPVLSAVSRSRVTHPAQQDRLPSPRSSANPPRSAEGSVSRLGCTSDAGSPLRGRSRNSGSRPDVPLTASSRSSREVSWVRDGVEDNVHERGNAEREDHSAAVPSSLGGRGHGGLPLSAARGIRYSTASLRGASNCASSGADSVVGNISATSASLMVSQSPSAASAAGLTTRSSTAASPHRQPAHSPIKDDNADHGPGTGSAGCRNDVEKSAAARVAGSPRISAGGATVSSAVPRRDQPLSRPASPLRAPALIPATAAGSLATPTQAAVSSTQLASADPTSTAPSHVTEAARSTNSLQLPAATDGVVLLNHVRDVPAQGELYRLLRVVHREPLQHFPQALRGPPLAVRLPDWLNNNDDSGYDDDDSTEEWEDNLRRVAAHRQQRGGPHASRSGSSASDASARTSRSASLLEGSHEHFSRHHRRNRSPHSSRRGPSSRQHSRSRSSSTSTAASQVMVAVNASDPRELFTRLVSDPADGTVEVCGLQSVLSSALSTSPHGSRHSRATERSPTHRASRHSTPASHANHNFHVVVEEEDHQVHHHRHHPWRRARSAFSIATHDGRQAMTPSCPCPSLAPSTSTTWQAEVVGNGFFNADIRLQHARSHAEAVTDAVAAYGEGCYYYTLPLIPLSPSSPRGKGMAQAERSAPPATRATPVHESQEVMEQLPRLKRTCKTPHRTQQSLHRFTARGGGSAEAAPLTARSSPVANLNDSAASRENVPSLQPSPMPPQLDRVQPRMPNPRPTSLKNLASLYPTNPDQVVARGLAGTPSQITGASPDDLRGSQLNRSCGEAGVPTAEYAPTARANASNCTPMRRRYNSRSVDKN
ncbi:hypothetical protein ABB37_05880 [Leptomonas pyrrhocoris]|uniref:Ig-like domain-containing protein n=1 Tax=Leptomonas pyrrhocoris TaxID=157538 RepID=A0A0M9FYX1_LEPPY|nr:hypothetical protein ABB37_05880 [Leptomonas pyrrhocoris]KPA78777.1 hypothetical protein ABB37_05880 [Leptomonas pyrrhocoris]|eukprot:XP_015657216.1 hypothetical protein ABB37_05880 [Leptomonas pyrrhocoris]